MDHLNHSAENPAENLAENFHVSLPVRENHTTKSKVVSDAPTAHPPHTQRKGERGRLRIIPYLAHTSSATISTILLKILLKIDHSNHSAENSAEKWRADYCLSQLISLPVQSILVLIFPRRTGSGIFSVIFSRFSAQFSA